MKLISKLLMVGFVSIMILLAGCISGSKSSNEAPSSVSSGEVHHESSVPTTNQSEINIISSEQGNISTENITSSVDNLDIDTSLFE